MCLNQTSPSIKLLIIDDDELLQAYCALLFKENGYSCDQLLNGEDIQSYFSLQTKKPDLVLLDVLLPGKNGFHWLQWLHKEYPQLPVIMLTGESRGEDRIQGLQSGAVDYVNKPFNSEELLLRVQTMLRLHGVIENKNLVFFGAYCFDLATKELKRQGELVHLTANEKHLLTPLCENYAKTVLREDLSKVIGVEEYHPLDRRIDVHFSRLRNKLDGKLGKSKYIHVVRNKGYFLRYSQ
ncbi:MAG TPA: response regulator transcription factor [Leucothrix mucor]|nr:response regulator transcription factor [Leucothrix mucor]